MTDDRFDRDLAARLRAYESRLPDEPAPALGTRQPRRAGPLVLLAGGGAAIAAVVLAFVVMQGWGRQDVGEPSLSPSVAPTIEPAPTAAPTETHVSEPSVAPSATTPPAASPTPGPATTDLEWTTIRAFPSDADGPSMVQHVLPVANGYVAVGVEYAQQLPNVGPTPPHVLLLWWSFDGRTWDGIDPGPEFENVEFLSVVERADGQLLAIGRRSSVGEFGYVESSVPVAWTSADGRTWSEVQSGLPDGAQKIVRGEQGYVALVHTDRDGETYELWHSADAETWTLAHTQPASRIDIGAGDEGFVAVGRTEAASDEPFAVASGDGLEWFRAGSPPPTLQPFVGGLGGNWVAMNAFSGDATMGSGETWTSANGLDWAPHGEAPLKAVEMDGAQCVEYPRALLAAGPWLLASTDLSYPCSEGGFAVHGSQLISVDGAIWSVIPFDAGTPGQSRSGASISAAVQADGGLIVGGELDGVATIWLGTQP